MCYCSCQNGCRDRLLGNIGKFNIIVKRWIKTKYKNNKGWLKYCYLWIV